MATFDAKVVREKADNIVKANKTKVEDARQLFLEEIMDWTDFYCENQSSGTDTTTVFGAVVELWIQYAQFEISLNQFKKAVDVFDKAIDDPVCKKSLGIYQTYAKFCIDRKKPGNAQSVFIQGLCAGLKPEQNEILWSEFLALMHSVNKSTALSVEELYEAVRSQDGVDEAQLAVPQGVQAAQQREEIQMGAIDANEAKEDGEMETVDTVELPATAEETTGDVSHTAEPVVDTAAAAETAAEIVAAVAPTDVKMEVDPPAAAAVFAAVEIAADTPVQERRYAAADDLDDVAGFTPEQLIRTFCARPPMLFTALHKEPTASGLGALTADPQNPGIAELEAFLGVSLSQLPSVTPNMHSEPRDYTRWTPADAQLDLLEGLWLAQALKERHFDSWISDLRNMHVEQEAALVDSFVDTESEAAAGKTLDEKAVIKKRQHAELMIFRNHCAVQQELLHALINKTQFALLLEQQTLLAQVGFPRFSTQFVESLKGYVQSRKSANNAPKAEFDPALARQVAAQRELVCALLSVRLHTISTERSRAAQLTKTSKLSRAQSIDQETVSSEVGGDLNYFDAEAKKRRKRRRIILQHHNDSYSQSGVSSYGSLDSPSGGGYSTAGGLSPGSDAGYHAGGAPYHQHQQHLQLQQGGCEGPRYMPPSYAQEQAEGNPAIQVLQKLSALIKPRGK